MPDITIRPANRDDISFLTRCADASYQQYVAAIGQKPAPMVYDFAGRLDAETIDLIENEGHSVGYMVWRFTADALFLDSIAVLPTTQGKGLARHAFDYLEAKAVQNQKPAIELYTNVNMSGNLTLYPHLGFVETGRRIEDGFSRVYFRKSLV